MLQNAYFLAKIGADTAENEQHFATRYLEDEVPGRRRCPRVGMDRAAVRTAGERSDTDWAASAWVSWPRSVSSKKTANLLGLEVRNPSAVEI